ncbi:heme ABC transporter ATP-binding protein [Photobacterium jeanii]|uniref:Heme ABC transporter ATP-binding protein n=1 Tax=Photobacterium jeanii TaxID=858640 RepID=A0A178KLS0_9GAMM|nr:heme ABC transporter ATP-binding protein [Photobacterium jeanii]OAN17694.1 heme ABC transporter ATP-binding protein [Photobacterium jeanii]PST92648.1 heme ABC transporter ATP-binding protein [Photobacterium jeanii]
MIAAEKHVAISAQGLNLSLGGKTLLDNFAIDIHHGEITALLGPNGAGKSTLLKVLCGELEAGGKINLLDKPQNEWQPRQLAKYLGVLPQHSSLSFAFTAQEVAELGGLPLSLTKRDSKVIATEMMEKTDVTSLSSRLYPSLSGGEKQRVHFARVLTQLSKADDKAILMLDEPTSALDLAHQHKTLQIAQEMAAQGAAVIIVLHDLNLAAQYADRLVIVNQGKIQADGDAWQALNPQTIERVYGWPVTVTSHPVNDHPVIL